MESVSLFRGLSPEHKATIADALKCEVFEKDDVVVSEGETGDKFYVVSSGEVSVYVGGADSYSTAKPYAELNAARRRCELRREGAHQRRRPRCFRQSRLRPVRALPPRSRAV